MNAYRRSLALLEEQGATFGNDYGHDDDGGVNIVCADAVRLVRHNLARALVLKSDNREVKDIGGNADAKEAVAVLEGCDLGQVHWVLDTYCLFFTILFLIFPPRCLLAACPVEY